MLFAVVLVAVAALAAGCGGSGDRSSAIADEIGATSCTATQYGIVSRIDNSKTQIYDCFLNGDEKCVTEENGIVSDQTAVVKLLFANTLSGGKPDCATG